MPPPWTSTPIGPGRRRSRPTSTAPTTGASRVTTDVWDPESLYAFHAAAFDDAAIDAPARGGRRRRAERPPPAALRRSRRACPASPPATDAERARAESAGSLAELTAELADGPDLARRIALEEARLDVVARTLTPLAAEGLERVRAEVRALGWPSPRALLAMLHGRDPGALAAEAEALLRATAAAGRSTATASR